MGNDLFQIKENLFLNKNCIYFIVLYYQRFHWIFPKLSQPLTLLPHRFFQWAKFGNNAHRVGATVQVELITWSAWSSRYRIDQVCLILSITGEIVEFVGDS
jgi:hypothetical protein